MEGVDLIDVSEDLDWWWAVGSTVNVYFRKIVANFMTGLAAVMILGGTRIHGIC